MWAGVQGQKEKAEFEPAFGGRKEKAEFEPAFGGRRVVLGVEECDSDHYG